MIKAVLFDLDGTLISTTRLYVECYRRALAHVFGRMLTDQELIELHRSPVITEVGILKVHAPAEQLPVCLETFYEAYEELHDTHFDGIYPGVPEMLAELRAADLRLGIITGKSRRAWEIGSTRIQLGDFDAYVFEDDVASPKPHPEGILKVLAELGVAAGDTVYVGDSRGDLTAASAAGVTPVAAVWSRSANDREAYGSRARELGGWSIARPEELPKKLGLCND